MTTNDTTEDSLVVTIGEEAEGQMTTNYISFWKVGYIREGYHDLKPIRRVLLGDIGRSR